MHLLIQLDRASPVPLQEQLFEQIRNLIIDGRIKPKSRVIGTRFLAEQIGVSRTTVLIVYERLISEGYFITQPTVGTFVSDDMPDHKACRKSPKTPQGKKQRQAQLHPSLLGNLHLVSAGAASQRFDFSSQSLDRSLLPTKIWGRHIVQALEQKAGTIADPLPPDGLMLLRQAIADSIAARQGITAASEQVIIVSGLRQAHAIVSHLFQRHGDKVVVESPCSASVIRFFNVRAADLVHVPVDKDGLMTSHLPEEPVSLACVTPARQNPTGGILSPQRQKELIEWAQRAGAYIVEDNSDGEIRYHGATPLSLAAQDPYGLVFHIGTFSKVLGIGSCLGYIVAPAEFAKDVAAIKSMSDDGCSWSEQMALARLLVNGDYDQHVRRVRRALMSRRDCLIQQLELYFGPVQLSGLESGVQVTWHLSPEFLSAKRFAEQAQEQGISIAVPYESSQSYADYAFQDRIVIMSYAAVTERQIKDGIAHLAHVFKPHLSGAVSAA